MAGTYDVLADMATMDVCGIDEDIDEDTRKPEDESADKGADEDMADDADNGLDDVVDDGVDEGFGGGAGEPCASDVNDEALAVAELEVTVLVPDV